MGARERRPAEVGAGVHRFVVAEDRRRAGPPRTSTDPFLGASSRSPTRPPRARRPVLPPASIRPPLFDPPARLASAGRDGEREELSVRRTE